MTIINVMRVDPNMNYLTIFAERLCCLRGAFLFHFRSNLKKQLTPVERYALAFIESNENEYRLEQLRAADAQIEAQKQDFDVEKIESLTAEVGADNSSKGSKGRLQSGT